MNVLPTGVKLSNKSGTAIGKMLVILWEHLKRKGLCLKTYNQLIMQSAA